MPADLDLVEAIAIGLSIGVALAIIGWLQDKLFEWLDDRRMKVPNEDL